MTYPTKTSETSGDNSDALNLSPGKVTGRQNMGDYALPLSQGGKTV
jgi:hypothetical protein